MRIDLREFQASAADRLVSAVLRGQADLRSSGGLQAISFSAPTGAGKTVIAGAVLESLFEEARAEPRRLSVLWLSDQPEINEQTRRRLISVTSLPPSAFHVIDASFNEAKLRPYTVHFLNTQKVARDRLLVNRGDRRPNTIWDVLQSTFADSLDGLLVVIDEAHRGMAERSRAELSVVQQFLSGVEGQMEAVPIVLGISATPERFDRFLEGSQRVRRPIVIATAAVRSSGLLKDRIEVFKPRERTAPDALLLSEAARQWQTYVLEWDEYCAQEREQLVRPLLVIQVTDGVHGSVSSTDIDNVLDTVEAEVGPLGDAVFAHAFQDGLSFQTSRGRLIRYLAPSQINADDTVKVVLFKTSLSTGWDCPRAEVMMSFRPAQDATSIAQLVGRMVRTPLARRVEEKAFLNSVALFLPYYDPQQLEAVLQRLSSDDFGAAFPLDVEVGGEIATLKRNAGHQAFVEALSLLPTAIIPAQNRIAARRRLSKLAHMLVADGIAPQAIAEARRITGDVLQVEARSLEICDQGASAGTVTIDVAALVTGSSEYKERSFVVTLSDQNVDAMFELADRALGSGYGKAYWRVRVLNDGVDRTEAKLEVILLASSETVALHLDDISERTCRSWLAEHGSRIASLGERQRLRYRELQEADSEPTFSALVLPMHLDVKRGAERYEDSLYVDDDSTFPGCLTPWERVALARMTKRLGFGGFYKNPVRGPGSVCIPYEFDGAIQGFYPDIFAYRRSATGGVIDIAEPHAWSYRDWLPKARALAAYAAEHHAILGVVEMLTEVDGTFVSLRVDRAMTRETVANAVEAGDLAKAFVCLDAMSELE